MPFLLYLSFFYDATYLLIKQVSLAWSVMDLSWSGESSTTAHHTTHHDSAIRPVHTQAMTTFSTKPNIFNFSPFRPTCHLKGSSFTKVYYTLLMFILSFLICAVSSKKENSKRKKCITFKVVYMHTSR